MRARSARRLTALMVLSFAAAPSAASAIDADPASSPPYAWVDLRDCTRPKLAPPRAPAETEFVYNVERRFLDLDRNGRCVVMDVWLERLASLPDSVSRNLVQRFYRSDGKRWVEFIAPELTYYPYALQSPDRSTVFVLAPMDADVGDQLVLGGAPPSVYRVAPRRRRPSGADGIGLTPYAADPRPIFRALARRLSERLASGRLVEEEPPTVAPADRPILERERIEMLEKAAR